MADVTISQLPLKASVLSTDLVPITDGNTTNRVTVSQLLSQAVPIGTIVMWSNRGGAGIPSGWQLCDGSNGTPDLRNRFVIGSGSSYSINTTGGSTTVSGSTNNHTLTVAQMPAHAHNMGSGCGGCGSGRRQNCGGSNAGCSFANAMTSTEGSSQGHSHTIPALSVLNPYYALAYIQKVS